MNRISQFGYDSAVFDFVLFEAKSFEN